MYSVNDLKKYEYFTKLLKDNKIEYVLDPLTGVIARKYILDFVKTLIIDKTPFTMAILDLDNFKEINDNYGHATGDRVLENIGNDLINTNSTPTKPTKNAALTPPAKPSKPSVKLTAFVVAKKTKMQKGI